MTQSRIVCIDDFAIKKGQTYGTLIVDYETSRVVDMIPSRDTDSVVQWLKSYPEIEVVSRDGSIGYAKAIREALPEAMQVSDRFHLVKNLVDGAKEYIKRTIPVRIKLEESITPTDQKAKKLTKAAIRKQDREEAKNELVRTVKEMYFNGYSANAISRELKIDFRTAIKYIKHQGRFVNASRERKSILDPYKDTIIALNHERKTIVHIFRTIAKDGYKGSYRSLSAFLAEYNEGLGRRHRKTSPESTLRRGMLISLLNKDISKFKEADQKKMKEYIETDGNLQNLYSAVNRFREILKGKDESRLEDWLSEVKRYNIRELNTFIMSVERDIEAVKNAIRTGFSNGIIEGVINKIKVIKRIMYGRCSFELLRLKAIMS